MAEAEAAATNPFDQIDPNMKLGAPAPAPAPAPQQEASAPAPTPTETAPVAQDNTPPEANPFDEVAGDIGPTKVSTVGAVARSAEKNFLPAVGSLPAVGAGAEIGATIGGVAGPYGRLTGAITGALAGGYFGNEGLQMAQNWVLSKLPDTWKDALQVDDRTARLDEQQHPVATFMGGLAPLALTMNPTQAVESALAPNATSLQRIMSYPVMSRVFGGALMGGMEIGNEKLNGGDLDWRKAAMATVFGVAFNRPNRVGESLTEVGARPIRSVIGPRPIASPEPTVAQAADMKVMGPGVTESVYRGVEEQSPASAQTAQENARIEHSEIGPIPEPAIHQTARQMEPELFAKHDDLIARRDALRDWVAEVEQSNAEGPERIAHAAIRTPDGNIVTSPTHGEALETIAKKTGQTTDQIVDSIGNGNDGFVTSSGRYVTREEALDVAKNAEQFHEDQKMKGAGYNPTALITEDLKTSAMQNMRHGQAGVAAKHLAAIEKEIQELSPEIAAANRRSADAVGAETVEPPTPEQTVAAEGAKPIAEQKSFIANDVTQKLVAAGRPAEEAQAAGELLASRYETRAARFGGKLGTAEELYNREGATIRGGAGVAPERQVPTNRQELAEYIKSGGEISAAKELSQHDIDWTPGGGSKTVKIGYTTIDYGVAKDGKSGEIILVKTPESARGHGSARSAMEAMTQTADTNGTTLFLNSDPMGKGTSKSKLDKFYKSLGFVKNIGKNKDFTSRAEFVRQPQEPKEFKQGNDLLDEASENWPLSKGDIEHEIQPEWNSFSEWTTDHLGLSAPTQPIELRLALSKFDDLIRRNDEGYFVIPSRVEGVISSLEKAKEAVNKIHGADDLGAKAFVEHLDYEMRKLRDLHKDLTDHFTDLGYGEELSQTKEFEQGARGEIRIAEGRRPIITLMKDANSSTFFHETGHQWLEELVKDASHSDAPMQLRDDAQTVRDWLGVKGDDEIKTRHHEKFARGFEQYLREGVAPSPGLAHVFAKFKAWLSNIYETIKRLGAPINEDICQVFDRLIVTEPNRTVVAPEREPGGPTIHDIHEAEATHTPPHEAEATLDRVMAESNRYIEEQPPEIQREIETARSKVEAEAAAARGETGDGAVSAGPVEQGGERPGPEPTSSIGGEEHGAVAKGGGAVGAESTKPVQSDSRSKLGDHSGTALAPGPTELFGARESPFTDRAGNIRLDTLNTADDVKQAIRDSAAENNDFIGDRRGIVTDGQVMELAYDIGLQGAEDLVQKHVTGQAFNAEQIVALRKLLKESASNVASAAKKAAVSTADEDVLAYAQARDRLRMVQKTVAGITAEAGRALRAFRKLPGEADTGALEQMVREATGKTLFQLKQEAKLASSLDTPQKMNKFMQEEGRPGAGAAILEVWINGLLSALSTQTTNLISNALISFQHFGPEKAVAALVGKLAHGVGREGTYSRVGEIGASVRGAVEGAAPALEAAGQAFKRGASSLLPGEEGPASGILNGIIHDDLIQRGTLNEAATMRDVGAGLMGIVRGVPDAIMTGGALLRAGGVEGAPFMSAKYDVQGAVPDIQYRGVNVLPVGTLVRAPGRFLATMDTFSRSLNYSMAKNAIAYRMASDEGLEGAAFARRIADIRDNPTPEVMNEARGVATEQTFMDKAGELAKRINFLTNYEANIPGVGPLKPLKFIAPFTNVVSRILDQTIVKRTPLGLFSKELQADLLGKNGNIAQDTAAARMILGSSLLLAFGGLSSQGYITGSGPKDPRENAVWRLNNQPHSVRIGDMFYQMSKLGPMGMLMGIAADLHDVKHFIDDDKFADAGAYLFHAIVQNTLDQSALQGPADFIKAVETPEQYGPQFIKSFLSSFVPASGMINSIANARDPYIRQTWGIVDAIKSKIPGWREDLHPRIDLWGQPTPTKDALLGTGITGIYMQKINDDPVNKALVDLGIKQGPVEKKIRGVELSPQQYEDFARIAGRMAKQRLDVIVRSGAFTQMAPFQKELIVRNTFKECREAASGMVKLKNPQIVADSVKALKEKINKKAPTP